MVEDDNVVTEPITERSVENMDELRIGNNNTNLNTTQSDYK